MNLLLKKDITTVSITGKELEIVQELAKDATVSLAAQNLKINKRTAEGRIAKLKAKTGCKTLPGLLWLFYKNGLIS